MKRKLAWALMVVVGLCVLGFVALRGLHSVPQAQRPSEVPTEPSALSHAPNAPPAGLADLRVATEASNHDRPPRATETMQAPARLEPKEAPDGATHERRAALAGSASSTGVQVDERGAGDASMPELHELSREGIRDAVASVLPELKRCYEGWLKAGEPVRGKIQVHMTIEASDDASRGVVTNAQVLNSQLDHPLMEACLLNALGEPQFDAPEGPEGKVEVTYPFVFEPD